LSPRMAVRVAVPLDPPIRRVVWAMIVVLCGVCGPLGAFIMVMLAGVAWWEGVSWPSDVLILHLQRYNSDVSNCKQANLMNYLPRFINESYQ
jgi:hypothetical protein